MIGSPNHSRSNQSVIEVVFKVNAKLRHGEDVRISGNVPALGCNNPARSLPLTTSPSEYPWWYTNEGLFLPGERNTVQYRYCIFSGGKFNRWESDKHDFVRTLNFDIQDGSAKKVIDLLGKLSTECNPESLQGASTLNKSMLITKSTEVHMARAKQFQEWNKNVNIDNSINDKDGVLIVSYFLPVVLSKSGTGEWSASWDNENLLTLHLRARKSWIGVVRYKGQTIPHADEEAVTLVLARMNCYPVFIDDSTHHRFYDIFCKQNLWTLMHHIADVYGPLDISEASATSQQDEWILVNKINTLFKNKVVERFHSDDIIWIHGFHLMCLPAALKRNLHGSKIGYYFHTPFPSSEIWKTITKREELLRGLLTADHIGFHLFEYARHFLTSCHRLLGYSCETNASGVMTVNVDGRDVYISSIHVGVDVPRITQMVSENSCREESQFWRNKFQDSIIITGIDRLERLKGIPLKLYAVDEFLRDYPLWRGKVVFVIIGISATERGADYCCTVRDVTLLRDAINKKYEVMNGKTGKMHEHVFFEEKRDFRLQQRLALLKATDILMITAPRDGLNRLPMEYCLSKQQQITQAVSTPSNSVGMSGVRPSSQTFNGEGTMILSEFISSAQVMRGALRVNPWKMEEVKSALQYTLGEMSYNEKLDRFNRNLDFSKQFSSTAWAARILSDIKAVPQSDTPGDTIAMGLGSVRVMKIKAGFRPLDLDVITRAFRDCKGSRLILFDWGGTLVAEANKADSLYAYALSQGHSSRSRPEKFLKDALQQLCSDPKNIVFVVSGKEKKYVNEFFGDIPNLGLAAEHGCYYLWPQQNSNQVMGHHSSAGTKPSAWHTMLSSAQQHKAWKDAARKVIDVYVQRTHGTYIEEKHNALIWQFRDADPEFGFLQSKELEDHLKEIMSGYSVDVIRGGAFRMVTSRSGPQVCPRACSSSAL
jgi:trehalose 6-phosphate synthase/phosphatase